MQKFSLNRLRGWLMRLPISCLRHGAFLGLTILVTWVTMTSAQEKSGVPNHSSVPAAKKSPDAKKQALPEETADMGEQPSVEGKGEDGDRDSPELIRKRDQWFYKQRSSANGHIPAGARFKAFQHMQRMMEAEGKLLRRPDGSYAAATTVQAASTPVWTSIGPTPTTGGVFSPVAGRVTTIAVDPSDASGNTVLIGGAQGGIWRTTDAGATWTAVGDQDPSLAMGSIAFAPSQPSTVYAGTGEQASIGFDIYYGAGVLKSTDHGQSWTPTCTVAGPTCPFIGPYLDTLHPGFGFFNFGGARISYVAVNPQNPNLVLAAAQLGIEGPTEGIYCSNDGGATWTNILPDEMATFVGFASPTVAFAAFGMPFGSSPRAPHGNGIYKSTNANSCSATFSLLSGGLPAQTSTGRIDLGISPNYASDNTVYASIADATTSSGTNLGVWITTNGGSSWTLTSAPDICQRQCWYDNVIKVDPLRGGTAFFGGAAVRDSSGNPNWVVRTTNSGASWSSVIPPLPALGQPANPGLPHVDNHAITLFKLPSGKVRLYLGNDGGIWRTDDAEASTIQWTNLNGSTLTLTQFYPTISIHPSTPSTSFGGTQDNSSQQLATAPSWIVNTGTVQTTSGPVQTAICGDGTSTAIDPNVPSTVYVSCQFANIRASYQTGAPGSFFIATNGINPQDSAGFIPPLVADPNNPNVVYVATNNLYQSLDAANSWNLIYNGIANPSNGVDLTTLAIGASDSSVLYAGLNTGSILIATGVTLGNAPLFAGSPGQGTLPNRAVTAITVDPSDSTGKTAYAAFSGFSFVGVDPLNPRFTINDPQGHIFKTIDAGTTWTDVSCSVVVPGDCSKPAGTDLPNIPVNDVVVDPNLPGVIYTATDLGVFVSNCSATPCTWSTLGTGLPHIAVLSMRLHAASRTLRAATHGRGAWDINLNNFSFSGPHISSLTPTSVSSNGAQFTLTVSGSALTGGTIQFGNTALTPTGTQTDISLSATVPTALLIAGSVKVTVEINPTTTSNALPFDVLALTPTITSLNPASTPVQTPTPTSNVPIQLTGTGFSSSAKILFNGAQKGITTTFNSSTSLTVTLPAVLLGPFGSTNDVAVLNTPPGGGQSQPATFKVAAQPPPNDNFANATNITALTFNDLQDSSGATTESSDPTPPCARQFTSAQGNTGGHPNGAYNTIWYKFVPAFSANLNVDTVGSTYDSVLSIWTGSSGSLANVACNDDIVQGVNIQSQLSNVPLTAGTTYYIMVSSFGPPDSNPIALGGKSQFNFSYNFGNYPAPILTSILPTSANSGDPAFTLTLNGSNFFNGSLINFVNATTSFGNGIAATFVSPTQLTATIPAAAIALPGPFFVLVVNPKPNFAASNSLNFTVNLGTYPVPTLSLVSPTTVIAGSFPFQLIATGSNFAPSAVLNFNGVAQTTSVAPSAQNAYAIISTTAISTPGTVQVTVSNPAPGGGTSAVQPFVITQPTVVPNIASVNPATIPGGIPTNFTLNGTGFTQGATLNVGGPGGNYYSTNFVSSTQLSLPNFAVNGVGTFPIYLIDPAPAGTSVAFNLTVTQPPPPTITSISPTSAQTGSTLTLTITGTNFQPGANVTFNNQNNFTYFTTFVSTTKLTTSLVLGGVSAGTYPLVVVNPVPSPTPSAPFNFIVAGPPDFSITSTGTTAQTVAAGQTATFTNAISVAAQNGFSAQVNLSCSLPVAVTATTTCTVTPNMFASGSGTATVTVTTMTRGPVPPLWPRMRFIFWPQYLPVILLTLLLSAVLLRLSRTRRQRFAGALPLVGLLLFLMLQAVGCGGGSSTPPPPTGTPAGTYTVTITGTSGATSHTTTVTLTVN